MIKYIGMYRVSRYVYKTVKKLKLKCKEVIPSGKFAFYRLELTTNIYLNINFVVKEDYVLLAVLTNISYENWILRIHEENNIKTTYIAVQHF